jgi:hypothetical protein
MHLLVYLHLVGASLRKSLIFAPPSEGLPVNGPNSSPSVIHRHSAVDRLLAIAPMLPHNRAHGSAVSPLRDCLGRFCAAPVGQERGLSLTSITEQIAADYRLSPSTVWGWYRRWKRGGLAALAQKQRADLGRSNRLFKRPYFKGAIRLMLDMGDSPFFIWKNLRTSYGHNAPSYGVVLSYARGRYFPDGESPAGAESTARHE